MGDRTTKKLQRLIDLERILVKAHPNGLHKAELARQIGINRSEITDYLDDLEAANVKVYETDDGKYAINPEGYKVTLRLSLDESLAVLLAVRLLTTRTDKRNPHAAGALRELARAFDSLAPFVSQHIRRSAEAVAGAHRRDAPAFVKCLEQLTRAWARQQQVMLVYESEEGHPVTHTFSTYFIEPYALGNTLYVIGRSNLSNKLLTLKVERIREVEVLKTNYEIPPEFDPTEILRDAWGIWRTDKPMQTVTLRFASAVAYRVRETQWHYAETITPQDNGDLIWQATIAEPREMLPWIRGWGADCEVLEPEWLRDDVSRDALRSAQRYQLSVIASDSANNYLLRCWGKTQCGGTDPKQFHPALFHMLDVGHVARILLTDPASVRWRRVLGLALGADPETLADWLPWFIALHDVGKLSEAFQTQNEVQKKRLVEEGFNFGAFAWRREPYHALVSAVFAEAADDALELPDPLRGIWIDVLDGHHGEFNGRETRRNAKSLLKNEHEDWSRFRREAAEVLKIYLLQRPPEPWPSPPNISAATLALTGFLVLCDWLGSDGNYFRLEPELPLEVYVSRSLNRARQAVEAAGFCQICQSAAPTGFANLFPKITPRPLQLAIDSIPAEILASPCLAIIEAPTGEGKTEASLALAHRLAQASGTDELYYALPTTATSNQMFGRVQTYLQERLSLSAQVKLIHGQAFLVEADLLISPLSNGDGTDSKAALDWLGNDKRKSLLMPFGVGTIDQAELAALNAKFVVLRLVGLAGKVVIMDEVHAYDTYMTTIVEQLLKWLAALGTSVILLSATLPLARRAALVRAYTGRELETTEPNAQTYPSLCIVSQTGQHFDSPHASQQNRQITIDRLDIDDEAVEAKAEWLLAQVAEGSCACWITNTVGRAQKLFAAVDRLAPAEVDRMLLHSRFPLEERQALEKQLAGQYGPSGKRPPKGIVIGTQVLEQSLDLDFDVMASDLAPVDFLLQRAGRLHRHANPRPARHTTPHLLINQNLEGGQLKLDRANVAVYDEYILQKTWQALTGRNIIELPKDYRPLIEAVYDEIEPQEDDPLRAAWEKLQEKQDRASGEARRRILPEPELDESPTAEMARMKFKEDENSTGWIVAQTRLDADSVTVIPLERDGTLARLWPTEEIVDLETEPSKEMQKRLRRRELRISDPRVLPLLRKEKDNSPRLFKESAWLKECLPLWLTDGKTVLKSDKETLYLTLDPKLGLVIQKAKEADL